MPRRLITALVLVTLLLLAGITATGLLSGWGERAVERQPAAPVTLAPSASPARAGAGFRSEARFREHFDKHGHEFGRITAAEYLALARTLRDRPPGPRVLEAVRPDGVISRFDRDAGAFLAFDRDGTIRTFFKPRDGEAYFRRQRDRATR